MTNFLLTFANGKTAIAYDCASEEDARRKTRSPYAPAGMTEKDLVSVTTSTAADARANDQQPRVD